MLSGQLGFWLIGLVALAVGLLDLAGPGLGGSGPWVVFTLCCVGSAVLGAAKQIVRAIERASGS
mgnify:CR=1 FL=1